MVVGRECVFVLGVGILENQQSMAAFVVSEKQLCQQAMH